MSEQNHKQKEAEISERPNIFLRVIYAILFLLVLSFVTWRIYFYKSAQEQLAVIDAAHAIPDSENAAIIYHQLFEDYNESDLKPDFLTAEMEKITNSKPWTGADYPELAKWFEQKQNIINKLMEVVQFKKCYFPIPDLPDLKSANEILFFGINFDISFLNIIKQSALFLTRSANNDIAEGRLEEALEKSLCVLRMGKHFKSQPMDTYFLVGTALEGIGSRSIRYIIFNDDVSEAQLKKIETVFEIPDSFEKQTEEIYAVERLRERISSSNCSLYERFIIWRYNIAAKKDLEEIYLRYSTDYRANLVLIALRRHKNRTGRWPENLEQIKSLAPAEAFIDPATGKQLQYENNDDQFSLSGEAIKIWPR